MNKIKFLSLSLVALLMACFTACNNDSIPMDYSKYIVGTWTAHLVNYAEALVFNADGTMKSHIAGPNDEDLSVIDQYFEDHGTYTLKGNKLTMVWSDGTKYDITITISPYKLLAFDYDGNGIDFDYDYCEEDLADEVVGMWVCTDGPTDNENDMMIQTFYEDGKCTLTGFLPMENPEQILQGATDYKVVGDILFLTIPADKAGGKPMYVVDNLTYAPDATKLGDVLSLTAYVNAGEDFATSSFSFLRVKETLDLAGKGYYYHDVFVSNVDGVDQDIDFMGYTFNFAKMTNSELNKLLNSLLFNVEFPDANNIQYIYMYNNAKEVLEAPIAVEGNKLTVKMSANEPALKDVVFYAFQDADNSQLHFYMHRDAFVNFHANMQVKLMAAAGQLDLNDAAAVKAVYDNIDAAVNTINVSLVFKAK